MCAQVNISEVLVPVPDLLHAKIEVHINKTEVPIPYPNVGGKIGNIVAKIQVCPTNPLLARAL